MIADSYDLTVELASVALINSPLTNKILVKPSLVQAAFTNLVQTQATLTAGVNYEFTIQARDIFSNIVVNSSDHISFEFKSVERQNDSVIVTNVTYEFHLYRARFSLPLKG